MRNGHSSQRSSMCASAWIDRQSKMQGSVFMARAVRSEAVNYIAWFQGLPRKRKLIQSSTKSCLLCKSVLTLGNPVRSSRERRSSQGKRVWPRKLTRNRCARLDATVLGLGSSGIHRLILGNVNKWEWEISEPLGCFLIILAANPTSLSGATSDQRHF